jgi:hypothetical protein
LRVIAYIIAFYLHSLTLFGVSTTFDVTYSHAGVDRIRESSTQKHSLPYVHRLRIDDNITLEDYLSTGPGGFCEIHQEQTTVRIGNNSIIRFKSINHFELIDGSILLCLLEQNSFQLSSRLSESLITGPCTIIAETTSNGGYKIISLSGKPTIKIDNSITKIPSGRLALVLSEGDELGDGYDIDLLLLLRSSHLINAFEEPPPTMGKIGLAVYAQQKKLKGKFNALIGDAPTDKNLQMWVLGSSQNKKTE